MRDLTADERAIVAGGWMNVDYAEDGLEEVVMRGRRYGFADMPYFYFYNPGGDGSGNGGGGGGDSGDEESEKPRDTPCVTDKPTGVVLADLHKAAIELKKAQASTGNSYYEHSALIYRLSGEDGVRWTFPTHNGSESRVWLQGAVEQLPPNAVIVGMYHSQPPRDGNISSVMSPQDWAEWSQIFDNPDDPTITALSGLVLHIGKGITADPNGLSYIYDRKTGNIHVYDRSDKGSDKQQCHVNERRGG